MIYSLRRFSYGVILLTAGVGTCLSAHAAPPAPAQQPITLETQVRFQGMEETNPSLGVNGHDDQGLLGAEARFRLTANLSEDSLFFWEGRGVAGVGQGGFETSDTGETSTDNNFLQWRQSYFQFNNLGGQPFSIKAGRQRVRESYGDWWDQNFDAIRLSYDTTLFSGFLLGGQNLFSYDTSQTFTQNQKDIFRAIAQGSWQYHYDQFFETRLMYQDDHSGIDGVGVTQTANSSNSREGNLLWAGFRVAGKTHSFISDADKINYRVDLMGVAGHENFDSTAPLGTNSVIVTGTGDADVLGWGLDADMDIPLAMTSKPVIHLGYAFGSGDDNSGDGTDHAFRQNGLEGNFSHIGVLSQNSYNYGTVLRPELSNINILTAGLTMPLFASSDGGILYHYYRLADDANQLTSSGVSNVLNGDDKDIGDAIDLLFNMDLYKDNIKQAGHINAIYLRTSLGAFRAGDAYGTHSGEIAGRGLIEVGFNF